MDYLYYFFIALAFLAVVLLLEGAYLVWRGSYGTEAKRIQKRLQEISTSWQDAPGTSLLKQRLLSESSSLQRLFLQMPRLQQLDELLLQSGMSLLVSQFLAYTIMAGVGGMACAVLLGVPATVMLLFAAGGAAIPFLFVLRAREKRLLVIEQQLPEAIDLMARALKAGHAFPGALRMAATEGTEPTAGEFRQVFDEINYGVSLQQALINMAARVPITDLRYFVIAVLIQRESGGNLAELLEKISGLIRARLTLLGKVRVLSAEGRMSAWILSCLPFAVALLLNIANPGFLSVLWTDPVGPKIVGGALGLMVVGIIAMSRIVKIRV